MHKFSRPPLYVQDELFACYVENPLVRQNVFRTLSPDMVDIPAFADAQTLLPRPHWDGHGDVLDTYWKAWELAFSNLGRPTSENGFVARYIDTAFNGHLFLWDSVFILMFGRYGSRAFDFQRTLDNLYARQHPDGFICREIDIADGQDCFHRHDPGSTGPNVLAWSEWEYYLNVGDRDRLRHVFPVLLAYHRWMRDYRTWPDGSYWSCGWACGMDNQPRVPAGYSPAHSPAHQAWVDACLQAILSARLLSRMADELGGSDEAADCALEAEQLGNWVNQHLWDDRTSFYYDRQRDGSRGNVKTVGAFWALLADTLTPEQREAFIAHLEDPREFNRPHRVPSLSADHPRYAADGGYWLGGVWPSTQYMVLRGLTAAGHDRLAHEIGLNHVENVAAVHRTTRTLWENYAPEAAAPGTPARGDFVGWGGIGPIAVLFEYVFGLRPDVGSRRLVWDVRRLESHGIERYPWGRNGLVNLRCDRRDNPSTTPRVEVTSTVPLTLDLRWGDGQRRLVDIPAAAQAGSGP